MKVRDMMSQRVITVTPEENLAVAARLLSHYNIGALPVCTKEGRLRGIVTDRDIVLRCVATEDDPCGTRVSDVMTRRIVSVDADEPINVAAELMSDRQIRRLPVQSGGRLVGMVSLGDLAKVPDFSTEAAGTLESVSSNFRRK